MGRISRSVAMLVLALTVLSLVTLSGVDARSPPPPPVRRVHTPRSRLSILPRSPRNPLSRPRSVSSPPPLPHELLHSDTIHLTVSLPDIMPQDAHLLLRPSEHIIHPNAFMRVDGVPSERIRAEDYRLYTGEVIHPGWINRAKAEEVARMRDGLNRGVMGTASVMVHHPGHVGEDPLWEGSFNIDGVTYHVKPTEDYMRLRSQEDALVSDMGQMVVFRDIDMYHGDAPEAKASDVLSCGHDAHEHNTNASHPIWANRNADAFTPMDDWEDVFDMRLGGLRKRSDTPSATTGAGGSGSNFINSINQTQGCPNSQQIVYMGFALDCNYVQTYNGGDNARRHILSVMNQVSDLYRRSFNVSLGIVELVVQNSTCPSSTPSDVPWNVGCEAGISLDERLSRFSQWRGQRSGDGAGLWHLMSACATDREVGVAWLGTVCQTNSNRQGSTYVSGTGVSTALQSEWSLVAHEIGHGFGAIHDCYDGCSLSGNCCPYSQSSCNARGRFIMNPTTSNVETQFSGCTLGNICSNIGSRSVQTSCFQTPGGRAVISEQQCGNGIVDDGEDCDPGFNSTSPCCDPETCRFRSGAVCDPNNKACCTDQCQFANNGTVCRPVADARCDFAETCPGTSADCPADRYRDDGTSCGGNGLECAAGRCTSLDLQCQQSSGSMNFTQACGQSHDTSCVIACRDPRSSNQCVVMQTPLLDGSPCGWAGRCYEQTCREGSWQSQFSSMYRQNLQISIPVTIVAALIILAILYFVIRSMLRCCGLCQGRQKPPRRGRGNNGPYPPPPMRSSAYNATGPGGPGSGSGPYANNPPPPAVGRHSGSVNSQDPITGTHVYNRDPSPLGPGGQNGQGYGQHGWAYSGGNAGGGGGGGGGNPGWVDASAYNGPNYGRNEAYGR